MSKKTSSEEEEKKGFLSNPTVAIALIGTIGTIFAALIGVLPQLLKEDPKTTEVITPALTSTIAPTSTPTETPTEVPPTGTPTEVPPTGTATLSPTPTPITPPFSCLDRWQVISSLPTTPESKSGCEKYNYPELGIEPDQNETLSFGITGVQIDEVTGITTVLANEVTEISFNIELNNLVDGEFWIALSEEENPEVGSLSIRVQNNGLVRVYDTNGTLYTEKTWDELRVGTIYGSGKPYKYKFVFKINGTSVNNIINDVPLRLPINPNYLFFGYKNKSSVKPVTIFATVSNLAIK